MTTYPHHDISTLALKKESAQRVKARIGLQQGQNFAKTFSASAASCSSGEPTDAETL